ncbi:MAG: tetratricopeptide repeat protein [Pseudomonadota bacterium]
MDHDADEAGTGGADLAPVFRLFAAGELKAAAEACKAILDIRPDDLSALNAAASIAIKLGRAEEAEHLARRLHVLAPVAASSLLLLGHALMGQQRWREAADSYSQALAMVPEFAEAVLGLGLARLKDGRYAEAEACFLKVLAEQPDHAAARLHLASVYRMTMRLDKALAAYLRGIRALPPGDDLEVVAHCELALTALALGDYVKGFEEYEWRFRGGLRSRIEAMRALAPDWDGRTVTGRRILLWFEQGLGDTIHFSRYAAWLAAKGMRVFLWVPPPLHRLMLSLAGVEQVLSGDCRIPEVDCQASLMSIPWHVLRGSGTMIVPREVPYLQPPADCEAEWKEKVARLSRGGRKAALIWRGNSAYSMDTLRSLDFAAFEPVVARDGWTFFSLQMDAGPDAVSMRRHGVVDLAGDVADFADTAAAMKAMDLVISADTSTIHCAGALGLPAWLLIPARPDWRWGGVGDKCPWYPTVRLFRQEQVGDWAPVIARIAERLGGSGV